MKKGIVFFIGIIFSLSACSQEPDTGIQKEILGAGINYAKTMQQNVIGNIDDSLKKVDSEANKYTDIASIKNDYNHFSKDEKSFTDDLGNLRIAFDDAIFNQDPKFNVNRTLAEESIKKFDKLVEKFEDKYQVKIR